MLFALPVWSMFLFRWSPAQSTTMSLGYNNVDSSKAMRQKSLFHKQIPWCTVENTSIAMRTSLEKENVNCIQRCWKKAVNL